MNVLLPDTVNKNVNNYNLRNANDLTTIVRRTELFSNSFIPSSITSWNNLSPEVKNLNTISQFKNALKRTIFKTNQIPKHFLLGNRFLSVMHARLRNGCSNLNNDLFMNHLQVFKHCSCGFHTEDTDHFLFQCPLYTNARIQMFRSLQQFHPLNKNLLLFGSSNLNDNDNLIVFNAVQAYIKSSNRFSISN